MRNVWGIITALFVFFFFFSSLAGAEERTFCFSGIFILGDGAETGHIEMLSCPDGPSVLLTESKQEPGIYVIPDFTRGKTSEVSLFLDYSPGRIPLLCAEKKGGGEGICLNLAPLRAKVQKIGANSNAALEMDGNIIHGQPWTSNR